MLIWNADTGGPVTSPLRGHTGGIRSVVFSPDGTRVASGSDDRTVRIWDSETGNLISNLLEANNDWVNSVSFFPDGIHVAIGSFKCTVCIWDSDTGDFGLEKIRRYVKDVTSVTFSPDCTRVAFGSDDGTMDVWDIKTGEVIAGPFTRHRKRVNFVAFSPDGSRIASGSDDKTIRIWGTGSDSTGHGEQSLVDSYEGSIATASTQESNLSSGRLTELNWKLHSNGWIKSEEGKILMWIPNELRSWICGPREDPTQTYKKLGHCMKLHIFKE